MVAALIVREFPDGRKLLLVHNIKHGLRKEPPGGKVERGESTDAAVQREVEEELGVRVRVMEELGVYRTESPEGAFDVHMIFCQIDPPDQTIELREPLKIGGYEWFTLQELRDLRDECRVNASHLLVPNVQMAVEDMAGWL